MAAKTAATRGKRNAILHSGMVRMITIALIMYFLGSEVGTLLNLVGSVGNTAIVTGTNFAHDAIQSVAVK